jgi:hypothetical protein
MVWDKTKPNSGNATTESVRGNFAAIEDVLSQDALDNGYIRAQVVSANPTTGKQGRLIFNTTLSALLVDDGSSWFNLTPSARMKCASYTGNGTNNREITGVGFQPDYVIVKRAGGTTLPDSGMVFRTKTMGTNESFKTYEAAETDCIKSFTSDGFTLGTDDKVNKNGETYHYIAFKEG